MKKFLAMVFAAGFVFLNAGCGGPHPKFEEKKNEAGETKRLGLPSDPQALDDAIAVQQQNQEEQQQNPPDQPPAQQ